MIVALVTIFSLPLFFRLSVAIPIAIVIGLYLELFSGPIFGIELLAVMFGLWVMTWAQKHMEVRHFLQRFAISVLGFIAAIAVKTGLMVLLYITHANALLDIFVRMGLLLVEGVLLFILFHILLKVFNVISHVSFFEKKA